MNPSLVTRHPSRPFVLVNMAMTADSKIATANRAVSSFSSARDQEHLLELRATVDAVMAGARTVDSALINLGPGPAKFRRLRLRRGLAEYNLRIVASGSGSVNPQAEIFKHRFSPIIVLTTSSASRAKLHEVRAVADEVKVFGRHEINLRAAFCWLRGEWGVKRLLCEGGAELNAALFQAGLVDELHLTICPQIFGGRDAPTVAGGGGFGRIEGVARYQIGSFRRLGGEVFAVFKPVRQR